MLTVKHAHVLLVWCANIRALLKVAIVLAVDVLDAVSWDACIRLTHELAIGTLVPEKNIVSIYIIGGRFPHNSHFPCIVLTSCIPPNTA